MGGVKKYDCPEVKLSKGVGHSVENLQSLSMLEIHTPLPTNKIGCRVIGKNRHNDNLVEKQTRAKIKP